jgi:Fe/S biogenesis protein NfuA
MAVTTNTISTILRSTSVSTEFAVSTESTESGDAVVSVTAKALSMVIDARSGEADAETLGLWLEANPAPAGKFKYDMWFEPVAAAAPDAVVVTLDGMRLVIPATSVPRLRGATLDVATDGSGMVLINPNEAPDPAKPAAFTDEADLSSPLAQQIVKVLEEQVNPSIAGHGGFAQLVGAEGDTVWLRLGGGCQGCASSKLTLRQGIEVAIKEAIPAIVNVIDVTDHQAGDNPYYK